MISPPRRSIDDRRGNDVHDEFRGGLHLSRGGVLRYRVGIERRGVDIHARSGSHQVYHDQPHDQRDRAENLEIEQSKTPGLAHLLHVFHTGDADDHRAENDRGNHHLD
jgi:hypothetical protein